MSQTPSAQAAGTSALPLTLGTAGHIDHGKTALIGALTGTDTDRLPQERARGISIELGYAQLSLPSGRRLSIVDVPGHERFVRTMVAGATGIDAFLMTIAADDGVMPQTREHAAILRALDLPVGVVAITKIDLADPDPASVQAAELLPGLAICPVSARTGEGLEGLRFALDELCGNLISRAQHSHEVRLHIDRVFTIRGAGTVLTGTLWSGTIARGDELTLLPARLRARVRGVQVHDQVVPQAPAGQRVAVNVTGLSVDQVQRGDVLVGAGSEASPSFLLDAQLEFGDREPKHGPRVQVHHGTRESPARLAWLGGRFWQIRLEQPLIAERGDRVVVRQIAPPDTLGGGMILDSHPRKHGPSRELLAQLEALARGDEPFVPAPPPPLAAAAASQPQPELTPSALALEQRLLEARLEPPLDAELDPDDLAALRACGRAVRVAKTLHYHPDVVADVRQRVAALASRNGGAVTLAQLRDELGTSRKFAQALLEYLDRQKVTIRRGDTHVVRDRTLD